MRVVLDTNVLLVSVSSRSKYHWLYQALLKQEFQLYITHDILNEYEEKIEEHWHPEVAKSVVRTLLELPNVHQTEIYFHLCLIEEVLNPSLPFHTYKITQRPNNHPNSHAIVQDILLSGPGHHLTHKGDRHHHDGSFDQKGLKLIKVFDGQPFRQLFDGVHEQFVQADAQDLDDDAQKDQIEPL